MLKIIQNYKICANIKFNNNGDNYNNKSDTENVKLIIYKKERKILGSFKI